MLFLHYNRSFQDDETILEAYHRVRDNNQAAWENTLAAEDNEFVSTDPDTEYYTIDSDNDEYQSRYSFYFACFILEYSYLFVLLIFCIETCLLSY